MRSAELHEKDYEAIKASIISDIWFHVKYSDGCALEIMETKGIPAIVTNVIDDQESETIDELFVRNKDVIAIAAGPYYDDVVEYNLNEFEVPMLIAILDSVEKHLTIEK